MSKDNSKTPPPIPSFSIEEQLRKQQEQFEEQQKIPAPLTPPQAERVRIINEAKEIVDNTRESSQTINSFHYNDTVNDARLSSLAFNEKEMKKIRQDTIKAFKDDLSDKSKTRDPTQGPLDIINSIGEVLAKKEPKVELSEEQKESLVQEIQSTYSECRKNYKDTHITGVSKNKKEKLKTAGAMVVRMMQVAIGAVGAAIGMSISYLGKRKLEEGLRIEREANKKLAKFDESKYEDYNNPEIDKLAKEKERGEEIQEKALGVMSVGSILYTGADVVEGIKRKNLSVSDAVSSTISAVTKKEVRSR